MKQFILWAVRVISSHVQKEKPCLFTLSFFCNTGYTANVLKPLNDMVITTRLADLARLLKYVKLLIVTILDTPYVPIPTKSPVMSLSVFRTAFHFIFSKT